MILLDTSFLVGYYRRIDLHHKEAIRMAEAYEGDQAFTISGVFQELLSVMNRKVSAEAAIQIGDLILSENSSVQLLKLDDAVFEVAWLKFKKLAPHKLSFVDCLLLATAEHMDAPLLTFDRELLSQLK
ncbi:MAG: PIN domain-containing protein [Patescibacteria group bacterium]